MCIARSLGDMQTSANIALCIIMLGCNIRAWATAWDCVNKELPLMSASFKFQDASTKTFSLSERPDMHGNASYRFGSLGLRIEMHEMRGMSIPQNLFAQKLQPIITWEVFQHQGEPRRRKGRWRETIAYSRVVSFRHSL